VKKKVRDAEASKARVFEAAAAEFAAHGFAGAKVDRIAGGARVNKAMIYYHFTNKAALYRAVIGDMFAATAEQVRALRTSGLSPESKVDAFIAIIAREGQAREHFPRMWLRELADGGRHMGEKNFADMTTIVSTLAAILAEGHQAGVFRAVPPFVAQVGIVGPLFLFMATAPMRSAVARETHLPIDQISPDVVVDYVRDMTKGALGARRPSGRRPRAATTRPPTKRLSTKRQER
jgi:AcrR family transcriptional regulator